MHIFLTGDVQVGKSTIINKTLAALKIERPGGFRSVSVPDLPDGAMSVYLIPAGDEAAVRTELEQLYRKLAAELLEPKVSDAAGRFGLTYRHVRVGGARGRWGSCSRDGGLNFSWRLVRWPEPVVDYVVVHELAHRIELNHSARYWREVERLCPGYRQLDRFLREHVPEYCPW